MKRLIDSFLLICVALVSWQVLVWVTQVPPYILPGPLKVWQAFVFNFDLILEHAETTVLEVLIGLIIGGTLGFLSAIYLMISATARRFLLPFLIFSQAVPVFALAPILTLWLGYGIASKILMAVLIIYFPVTSNFYDGLQRTDIGLLDLGKTMGATKAQVLWHLRLPSALPSLGSGLSLAAVYAPIGAVIGEWVGSSKGLGFLMLLANGRAKIDLMFAALIILALFTVLLHRMVSHLSKCLSDWTG